MKHTMMMTSTLMLMSWGAMAQLKWHENPVQTPIMAAKTEAVVPAVGGEAVRFNQPLLGETLPTLDNRGYVAESKQFYLDVDAKALRQGVPIPLTSDQAVVRISPVGSGSAKSIASSQLRLNQQGQALHPEVFVNAEQLKATGMPAAEQTVAFKVTTTPGPMQLKIDGLSAGGQYMIHVLEPNSNQVMKLATEQQSFASGADVVITASLEAGQKSMPMQVSGYVTQPNGEPIATLKFQPNQQGQYQAVVSGLKGQSLDQGLWEVHTVSEAQVEGLKVMRDVSTAFALQMPTARFDGSLQFDQQHLIVGIENAMPARYGIQGVLTGTDQQGEQQPIALLMSAQWLSAGKSSLSFEWPADMVAASGLKAPYAVRDLKLENQSLMVPVQTVRGGFQLLPSALDDMR